MIKARKLAKIMKALSNENRLALYLEIAKQKESNFEAPRCNVSHIVKMFRLTAPTISHHLKELVNADLITTEKQGRYLVARINMETLAMVTKTLSGIENKWER